jgi:hypothetical protein
MTSRNAALLALSLLAVGHAVAGVTTTRSAIDLDRPGALEALRERNPVEYRRIDGILRLATKMPCPGTDLPRMLKAEFGAEDAFCSLTVYTSYPARRRLTFSLEGTAYNSLVVIDDGQQGLIPAKQ